MNPESEATGYRAHGFRFEVRVEGMGGQFLTRILDWTLEGLRAQSDHMPRQVYRLTATGRQSVKVTRDEEVICGEVSELAGLTQLVNDLNRQAIASCPERLSLHAGAVAAGGQGLLLPANSGSGKTTLTAALVRAGCDYLTDEAAAVDLSSFLVEPYAKPLSLSPSSQAALGCSPSEHGPMELIPASWLRPDSYGGPVRPSLIVFPSFEPDAPAQLTPLTRGEALVELANNSFNFVDHGGEWLPALRDIVAVCDCWRITFGNALEAAEVIMERLVR